MSINPQAAMTNICFRNMGLTFHHQTRGSEISCGEWTQIQTKAFSPRMPRMDTDREWVFKA
jgi:hypothetical protein